MTDRDVNNVLCIVIDSLRRDFVSTYYENAPRPWDRNHSAQLTPSIDRLARDGERFDFAFANINATDPSMTTIRSGQYPARHGIRNHGRQLTGRELEYATNVQSVFGHMEDQTTIAVEPDARWHQRGFDIYRNPNRSRSVERGRSLIEQLPTPVAKTIKSAYHRVPRDLFRDDGESTDAARDEQSGLPYPTADTITDEFIEILSTVEGSWGGLLHFYDAHLPYLPPAVPETDDDIDYSVYEDSMELKDIYPRLSSGWREGLEANTETARTVGDVVKRIAAGVRFVDEQIDRLITTLEDRGELSETAIIVTAGHGESIDEHDIYFSHHGLYDPTTHIPLIISAPGFGGVEERLVQHVDIAPTISSLLGLSIDDTAFDGVSLSPENRGALDDRDCVFIEERSGETKQAMRTREWKYIRDTGGRESCRYCGVVHGGKRELYDLTRDGEETANVADEHPEECGKFDAMLEEWLDSLPNPEGGESHSDLEDEDILQQLDDLGYIS